MRARLLLLILGRVDIHFFLDGMPAAPSLWKRVFPILDWLPAYRLGDLGHDVVSGFTSGVMLIPMGMAYAVIAGLPPIYGLYAGLVPLLVYPLLGSSRHLALGPIAIDMLIVAAGIGALADVGSPTYVVMAIVLTLMTGLLQVLLGVARLGFIANFLSRPVIVGFTAAAALIIGVNQLGNLLLLDLGRSQYVHVLLWEAARHLNEVHLASLGIGGLSVVLMVGLRAWKRYFPGALVVVVVGIVAVWGLGLEAQGVEVVGAIPQGLPPLVAPEVSLVLLRELLPTAITLALVQFMGVVSLGQVFATRHRYTISPNRELLAIGAANMLGSFFRSLPVSGSFSRTAVNVQTGARSALSNVVTAGLIGLTLLFLTPLFYYLPMPVLAAIIMVSVFSLIDVKEVRYLFVTKRRDGYIALFTFSTTLIIGIQEGILLGIAVSMLAMLYRISRPHVAELGHLPGTRSFRNMARYPEAKPPEHLLILRVDSRFSFMNAKYFKDYILAKSEGASRTLRAVIIEGTSINDLDTTAVTSLREIMEALQVWDMELYITGLKGPVRDVVRRSGLYERLGPTHFHMSPHRAVKHILAAWDARDGTNRLEQYLQSTDPVRADKARRRIP